ncbi:MAG: ThuA domain-containing protein [Planctomycetota bacterium]|jgi:type 1 glutamine amidotransferase
MAGNFTHLACMVILVAGGEIAAQDSTQWVVYDGHDGPGKGKHIVFVTGDEEYRSEEGMPQLARILAQRHGFRCTVLFAVNPESGEIDPDFSHNIPGLQALDGADLMVIFTRFRDLPDEQMKHIVAYVDAGRPIVGLRTATHAFHTKEYKTYQRYDFRSKEWPDGFGRQILGETWIAHHGAHGSESARGIIARDAAGHPIVRGIKDGDIWDPSDVYTVRLPMMPDVRPIIMGQVLAGMTPDDEPLGPKTDKEGKIIDKNDPMMPVAWIRELPTKSSKLQRVFATTLGTSQGFTREGTRRLLVNACYWAVGLEDKIRPDSNVALVGKYEPSPFGFGGYKKGIKPADHRAK